jgi:hypothetical protein
LNRRAPWHFLLDRYDAAALVGSALYLSFAVISPRGIPFLLGGDEQFFWANALRMLNGELIYRDFLEFTPPGTDLVYLGAFELLGPRIWVPNVVVITLGTILCWLCFQISRQIMKPAPALLVAALFLIQDYGKWLDATHHWFSLMAALSGLAVLMKARTPARIVLGGAAFGLASFFSQTRGVSAALGVAGFLLWDRYRTQRSWRSCLQQLWQLALAFAAAWTVLSGYFLLKVGIAKVWYYQTLYVLRYVNGDQSITHHQENDVFTWPTSYMLVYFAIPVICGLCLWISSRDERNTDSSSAVALLAFAGALMFLEVAQNVNPLRVDAVAAPAFVLLVWLLSGLGQRVVRYATPVLLLGLLALGGHRIGERVASSTQVEDLPAGRVVTAPASGEQLAWIAGHTTPGEYFFESSYVSVYLPLALRSPAYALLGRQFTTFVNLDIQQLEAKRVRYILWSPLDEPRFPKFEQFLAERYQRVWTFSNQAQIWERKDAPRWQP